MAKGQICWAKFLLIETSSKLSKFLCFMFLLPFLALVVDKPGLHFDHKPQ